MKGRSRRRIGYITIIVFIFFIVIRVIWVNQYRYAIEKPENHYIGESFEWKNFLIKVNNVQIMDEEELIKKYPEIPQDYIDKQEYLIDILIKNCSDTKKTINVSGIIMQNGIYSGGSVNPYLYGEINKEISEGIFQAGEERNLILPYPKSGSADSLIFQLYEKKITVDLSKKAIELK